MNAQTINIFNCANESKDHCANFASLKMYKKTKTSQALCSLQQKEIMKKGTINNAKTLPPLKCRNERTRKEQEGIQKLFIHSNAEMKEEERKKRIF